MDITIKKQAKEAIETLSDKKASVALDIINYLESDCDRFVEISHVVFLY